MPPFKKSDPIVILGAGVFGLSSALHLASSGYTDVTLFDRHDHGSTDYDSIGHPDQNDGASCDLNKIMRTSYGNDQLLHDWAMEALRGWEEWNAELERRLGDSSVPLFERCGYLRLDDAPSHRSHESGSLALFSSQGFRHTQYDISLQEDISRAEKDGWSPKLDPCGRRERSLHTIGVLDTTAGFVHASRACAFVLQKVRSMGVKTVMGGPQGAFSHWGSNGNGMVRFHTEDGQAHTAAQIVMALGPWSTAVIPELRPNIRASAGCIAHVQISPSRADLRRKYSVSGMPIVQWKAGKETEKEPGGGVYSFPATPDSGIIKIGARGIKYLNPVTTRDGSIISVPRTAATVPAETRLPARSLSSILLFLHNNMPDLGFSEEGEISMEGERPSKLIATRLCYYTDTFDNQFYICPSPSDPCVIICTGGSGHGFKFLPVLGQVTRDVLEGRVTELTKRFSWRQTNKPFEQGMEDPSLLLDEQVLLGPESMTKASL